MARRRKRRKTKPEGEIVVDIRKELSNAEATTIGQLRDGMTLQRQHDLELLLQTLRKFYEAMKKYYEGHLDASGNS